MAKRNTGKNEAVESESTDGERERKTFVEASKAKALKVYTLATKLVESDKVDAKGKRAAEGLMNALKPFGEWLASLPADFAISMPSTSRTIEVGDNVTIIDELLEMYPCGKGPHKVLAVKRLGGQPGTGRGGKVFVTIETKRGNLAVPSNALD